MALYKYIEHPGTVVIGLKLIGNFLESFAQVAGNPVESVVCSVCLFSSLWLVY